MSSLKSSVIFESRECLKERGPSVWWWQERGGWRQHLNQGTSGCVQVNLMCRTQLGPVSVWLALPDTQTGPQWNTFCWSLHCFTWLFPFFHLFFVYLLVLSFYLASYLPIQYSLKSLRKFCCYPVENIFNSEVQFRRKLSLQKTVGGIHPCSMFLLKILFHPKK